MATNEPTLQALERISELVRELRAWDEVLRRHRGQQGRQDAKYPNDEYRYDEQEGKVHRYRNGERID